jgi:DNA modification methylase
MKGDMRIEYVSIAEIKRWPGNPKFHAADDLDASIHRFGFVQPILVDETTGKLVAGHGRVEALERQKKAGEDLPVGVRVKNGDWLVPVIRGVAFASEREAEAYLLADNRLVELGGWDDDALRVMLSRVMSSEINLDGVGWSKSDLDSLFATAELPHDLADFDVEPPVPAAPISKGGDLWLLGEHRLLCGSCENVSKLMGDARADLLVTDPPYGVNYASKNAFLNVMDKGNRVQKPIAHDHHPPAEMGILWKTWFSAVRSVLRGGAAYYVTGPQVGELLLLLLQALRDSGFPIRHMLVWAKNQLVLGRCDYHYQHEPIIYGWLDGAGHRLVEDRGETSLWQIPKPRVSDLHPTMKPVELYARAMRNSSVQGEIVLDPFVGSGTCLVAAEKMGRRCFAAEIEPHYVDVAIERWAQMSGGKARRA